MNKEYLKINEIKTANWEYKNHKRLINKSRQKVRRLLNKYSFIESIVSPSCNGDKLEEEISKLFNSIGYEAKVTNDKKDLDVYAVLYKDKLGIEVKGEKTLRENEALQAHKYAQRRRQERIELHPILIWNNSGYNNYFDPDMIRDAKINEYSLITTQDLLKGYLKVQQGKLTVNIFHLMLKQCGSITFSNLEVKKFKEDGQ